MGRSAARLAPAMTVAAAETGVISIIVPALNEAGGIVEALQALQEMRGRGHEVIVVDGGSSDHTAALSRPLADRVLMAAAGRARQMQAGTAPARGSVLWFLHADTRAPREADRAICAALQGGDHHWGRFDVCIPEAGCLLSVVATLMNLRSRLTGIATGDQGIFVSRELFDCVGGFPQIPLMEDIALSRRLKSHCRPACLNERLITSARRWRRHGTLRTILLMWSLRLAYWLGVSPVWLAQRYPSHHRQ
jgi:rSAM/selenodomain-associated transferase 2